MADELTPFEIAKRKLALSAKDATKANVGAKPILPATATPVAGAQAPAPRSTVAPEDRIPPAPPAVGGPVAAPKKDPRMEAAKTKLSTKSKPKAPAAATSPGITTTQVPGGTIATVPQKATGTESGATAGSDVTYTQADPERDTWEREYLRHTAAPEDPAEARARARSRIGAERVDARLRDTADINRYQEDVNKTENRRTWDAIIGALGKAVAGGVGLATGLDVGARYKYEPQVDVDRENKRSQYALDTSLKSNTERLRDAVSQFGAEEIAAQTAQKGMLTPEKSLELRKSLSSSPKTIKDFKRTDTKTSTEDKLGLAVVPNQPKVAGGGRNAQWAISPDTALDKNNALKTGLTQAAAQANNRGFKPAEVASILAKNGVTRPVIDRLYAKGLELNKDNPSAAAKFVFDVYAQLISEGEATGWNPSRPDFQKWYTERLLPFQQNYGNPGITIPSEVK